MSSRPVSIRANGAFKATLYIRESNPLRDKRGYVNDLFGEDLDCLRKLFLVWEKVPVMTISL
jgi:hypothetical protein